MGTKKSREHLRTVRRDPELPDGLDRVVSEAQCALILGISKDSLRRAFRAGRSPARVKVSDKRIGYRVSEIYKFLDLHTEAPGKQAGA
jgi:predicted DNA-binding transcriptional regulator AlpA